MVFFVGGDFSGEVAFLLSFAITFDFKTILGVHRGGFRLESIAKQQELLVVINKTGQLI
jgi:hypothetical protein